MGGAEPHGGSLVEVCGGSWSLHLSASHCVCVRIASRAGKKTTTQRIGANSPGRRHREERGEVPVPTSQRGGLVVQGSRRSTQKGVASVVGNYRPDEAPFWSCILKLKSKTEGFKVFQSKCTRNKAQDYRYE